MIEQALSRFALSPEATAELCNVSENHTYRVEDPFVNHPLFKTEEQARIEDTLDGHPGVAEQPVATEAVAAHDEDGLWGRSRDFDWGD